MSEFPFAGPARRCPAVLPLGVALPFNTKALTVIPRVDTFLIALVSTSAAGFFAIGDRILGPAAIILVASCALYPFFVRETHTSRTPWLIASGFFGAGAAIAAVASLLAPTLVPVIFGAAYEDAVDVVQLADDPPVDDPPGTLGMRRSENWHGRQPALDGSAIMSTSLGVASGSSPTPWSWFLAWRC